MKLARLKTVYQGLEANEVDWRKIVGEAEQFRIYERIPPEQPYGNLDAMLRAEIGKGLEEATSEVKTREQKAQETAKENARPLQANGGARAPVQSDEEQKCQTDTVSKVAGNLASYRVRKLRRDNPEAAKRLEQGEFKSVAAAERWARGEDTHPKEGTDSLGSHQATTSEAVRRGAPGTAEGLWASASPQEREAFADWVSTVEAGGETEPDAEQQELTAARHAEQEDHGR